MMSQLVDSSAAGAAAPEADLRRRMVAVSLFRLALDRIAAAREAVGGDLVAGLVMATISNGNLAGLEEDEALNLRWSDPASPPPDDMREPVSGYSVALQLGMARETVRRKINMLIEEGLIANARGGYVIPASLLVQPSYQELSRRGVAAAAGHFLRMEALGEIDDTLARQARRGPQRPRMVGRTLNALLPRVLDAVTRLTGGDLKCALLFIGILVKMHDEGRASATAWAEGSPRITAIGLSGELGLSRETARRHVRQLAAMDLICDGPRGLFVTGEVLRSRRVVSALDRACANHDTLLGRLAQAGVLASAPGEAD
jgi:biotin operon repressor